MVRETRRCSSVVRLAGSRPPIPNICIAPNTSFLRRLAVAMGVAAAAAAAANDDAGCDGGTAGLAIAVGCEGNIKRLLPGTGLFGDNKELGATGVRLFLFGLIFE